MSVASSGFTLTHCCELSEGVVGLFGNLGFGGMQNKLVCLFGELCRVFHCCFSRPPVTPWVHLCKRRVAWLRCLSGLPKVIDRIAGLLVSFILKTLGIKLGSP